jgi:hypothetical protein
MGAMAIALGFAVLFNFVILRIKWNKGNYVDVGVDVLMLVLLNIVFGGSILGVVSATMGSTLISLYLIWFPVKLFEEYQSPNSDGASYSKEKQSRNTYRSMADKFDSLFD